jgi:hypothetical protein
MLSAGSEQWAVLSGGCLGVLGTIEPAGQRVSLALSPPPPFQQGIVPAVFILSGYCATRRRGANEAGVNCIAHARFLRTAFEKIVICPE